jgi:hypothetical protein
VEDISSTININEDVNIVSMLQKLVNNNLAKNVNGTQ